MGFGTGIFLVTAGAILAFGIKIRPWWVDLDVVGLVLMLSGLTVIVLTAWYWHDSRVRVVVQDRTPVAGATVSTRPDPQTPPVG
jgi:hypothetical protein